MSRLIYIVPTSDNENFSNAIRQCYYGTEADDSIPTGQNATNLYQHLDKDDESSYIWVSDGGNHDKNTYEATASVVLSGTIPNIPNCHIVRAVLYCRHYHKYDNGNKQSSINQSIVYKINNGSKITKNLSEYENTFQTEEIEDLTSQISLGQTVNCNIDLNIRITRPNPNSPACYIYFSTVFIKVEIDGTFNISNGGLHGAGSMTGINQYHLDDLPTITFNPTNDGAYVKRLYENGIEVTEYMRGNNYIPAPIDHDLVLEAYFSDWHPPYIDYGGMFYAGQQFITKTGGR